MTPYKTTTKFCHVMKVFEDLEVRGFEYLLDEIRRYINLYQYYDLTPASDHLLLTVSADRYPKFLELCVKYLYTTPDKINLDDVKNQSGIVGTIYGINIFTDRFLGYQYIPSGIRLTATEYLTNEVV